MYDTFMGIEYAISKYADTICETMKNRKDQSSLEMIMDSIKLKIGGLYLPGNLFYNALKKMKGYIVRLLFPKSVLVLLWLGNN